MDQLKVFWAGVVKYHFWILTTLVLLSALGAFYVSRSELDQQVSSRISTLENQFRAVSTLQSSARSHPNEFSEKMMDVMLAKVTNNVNDAWTKQYERQSEILTWSRKAIASDEAFQILDRYRPIENSVEHPMPPGKELALTYRTGYRDYIKDVFPDLARIIGAQWTAQLGGQSGAASVDPASTEIDGAKSPIVHWSQTSQSTLQNEMIPWYSPTSSPSTADICYTQEDIWILAGILEVIKETNGKAKENFQAAIKEVEWIRIGKAAGGGDAATSQPDTAGGGEMSSGQVPGVRQDPANNRYVDSNYKPVPGATLRSAMKSSNPEDAFFAVAKRVPVRFKVKMDQSKIAKLLAECGNARLMIEVKKVRINADETSGISISSSPVGGGGGMSDSGGMDPMSSRPEGGFGGFTGGGGEASTALDAAHDPPVEIYGIVYLFNPVDVAKLGLDKVTENTALVTTATPTPPVAPPTVATPENAAPNEATPTVPTPNPGEPVEAEATTVAPPP